MGTETRRTIISLGVLLAAVLLTVLFMAVQANTDRIARDTRSTLQAEATQFYAEFMQTPQPP